MKLSKKYFANKFPCTDPWKISYLWQQQRFMKRKWTKWYTLFVFLASYSHYYKFRQQSWFDFPFANSFDTTSDSDQLWDVSVIVQGRCWTKEDSSWRKISSDSPRDETSTTRDWIPILFDCPNKGFVFEFLTWKIPVLDPKSKKNSFLLTNYWSH